MPLGADDEAAGTPASPERVRRARVQELAPPGGTTPQTKAFGTGWIMVVAILVIAIVVVASFLYVR
ncbi:MAG: hypothetical protein ACXWU2_05650 [Allosphingosinicella sp.]